jgi:prevent-host-death family protein
MRAIGVRELKTHASEIMRNVREDGVCYTITYRGKPVGVLLPLKENGDIGEERVQDPWSELEKIRDKMALMPQPKKSLIEELSEMRR